MFNASDLASMPTTHFVGQREISIVTSVANKYRKMELMTLKYIQAKSTNNKYLLTKSVLLKEVGKKSFFLFFYFLPEII